MLAVVHERSSTLFKLANLALLILFPVLLGATSAQASNDRAFLVAQRSIEAPSGFVGLCARYDWVCASSKQSRLSASQKMALVQQVNRTVNRQVRQIDDQQQYGKAEHWALPTRRGGDCEDLVLLKKKLLIERGVPSRALLISTVLDRNMDSHAVLVLRTTRGDLVLDNLTNKILPWAETGYTFLKLQNPDAPSRWHAILSRGDVRDQPTATR
jgi:predicted transglutaminase-like cysteine proteinase